ncbi:MAG: type II toxin-antitoxin system RelE/ParE family toxin [Acidobacteriota bacterium]
MWSEAADLDLQAISARIAQADLDLALLTTDRIDEAVSRLSSFPMRGRVVPELLDHGITVHREIVLAPWRIVYRVLPTRILVLGLVDGRRNVEDLLLQRLVER